MTPRAPPFQAERSRTPSAASDSRTTEVRLPRPRTLASCTPAEVPTEQTVRAVLDLDSHIIEDPVPGRPLMRPIGRHHVLDRAEAVPVAKSTG